MKFWVRLISWLRVVSALCAVCKNKVVFVWGVVHRF